MCSIGLTSDLAQGVLEIVNEGMTGKSSEMPLETAVVMMGLLYIVLATRVETGETVHTTAEPSVDEAKELGSLDFTASSVADVAEVTVPDKTVPIVTLDTLMSITSHGEFSCP